jgi:hypothetical protein
LAQIVTAAISLSSTPVYLAGASNNLPCRLLRYRLEEGPKPGWERVDLTLHTIFDMSGVISPSKADIFAILNTLRTENWGDEGEELWVRAMFNTRISNK